MVSMTGKTAKCSATNLQVLVNMTSLAWFAALHSQLPLQSDAKTIIRIVKHHIHEKAQQIVISPAGSVPRMQHAGMLTARHPPELHVLKEQHTGMPQAEHPSQMQHGSMHSMCNRQACNKEGSHPEGRC